VIVLAEGIHMALGQLWTDKNLSEVDIERWRWSPRCPLVLVNKAGVRTVNDWLQRDTTSHHTLHILHRIYVMLVTASVVPSSPILVALMMEAIRFSETSVITRATGRNIPEDTILQITLSSYKTNKVRDIRVLEITWPTVGFESQDSLHIVSVTRANELNVSMDSSVSRDCTCRGTWPKTLLEIWYGCLVMIFLTWLLSKIWGFHGVTMKNAVFWDVTPSGSCKNRRFGGTPSSGWLESVNQERSRNYQPTHVRVTNDGEIISVTRQPPFTARCFPVITSVRDRVERRTIVRFEDLRQL
jgi:hypothetical protein